MKFTLNKDAKKAYFKALKQGIVEDSIEDSDLEIDQKQKAFVELQEAKAKWERHL